MIKPNQLKRDVNSFDHCFIAIKSLWIDITFLYLRIFLSGRHMKRLILTLPLVDQCQKGQTRSPRLRCCKGGRLKDALSTISVLAAFWLIPALVIADQLKAPEDSPEDTLALHEWRSIGPDKGGRSIAVAGHKDRPNEYFFGATGGGLWKTTDSGLNWRPVTDGMIHSSSVGSVAVAPSDADVVYLGMGEGQLRSNVLQGDGMYRSDDAGETWKYIGLEDTRVISTIQVHPADANVVYAAALGDPYTPSEARGVFRSTDGGQNWRRILFRSPEAGAIDVAIDPSNPNVLYATLWEVYRKPWKLWSGGDSSGVFKSVDGGDTWREITSNAGLPAGPLGKMALAVSPANSKRVWLNVEAAQGGLYRSDDGGESWLHVNGHRDLWQRSFYFMQVRAHPVDPDTVYVLNFALQQSSDGGQSFVQVPTRHVDIHDLWIDPSDPERMVVADDGGASVSINGGQTWTEQDLPTAQFYRVATTTDFPYHVCGAQQDADSICVPSRGGFDDPGLNVYSSYYAGGGENSYIAPHPTNSDVFFASATNTLNRYDRVSQSMRNVHPWPYLVMGQSADSMAERWNWVFPIVFSPITPHSLYVGSQHLWRSDDEGRNWNRISPDLTRADPSTLGDSGGPIILDQDGPEIYATLHTIAPSHHDQNVIWTGSDDGKLHLTQNAGKNWNDVTPPDLMPFTRVSLIEASPHRRGTAFVAGNRYDLADRRPYIWMTSDFGRSWSRIDADLPKNEFVHAVREDTLVTGLLYAGTEHGVQVSLDLGQRWLPLRNKLPVTRVTDIAVKGDDLVISTHGRGFYVLSGLATLRQIAQDRDLSKARLFEPAPAWRRVTPATIDFWLPQPVASGRLEIRDQRGSIVRTLFSDTALAAGQHRWTWDLRHAGATVFDDMILEAPSPETGPWAVPGDYSVHLWIDGEAHRVDLRIELDPRLTDVSLNELQEQLELALHVRDSISLANETVLALRQARAALELKLEEINPRQRATAMALVDEVHATENSLYQTKNQSPKDKIAYPIRLNDRLSGLLAAIEAGDAPPTRAQFMVFQALESELNKALNAAGPLLSSAVPAILGCGAQRPTPCSWSDAPGDSR